MPLVYLSRTCGTGKNSRRKPGDQSPGYFHPVPAGDRNYGYPIPLRTKTKYNSNTSASK
jgi:hypothetical protein